MGIILSDDSVDGIVSIMYNPIATFFEAWEWKLEAELPITTARPPRRSTNSLLMRSTDRNAVRRPGIQQRSDNNVRDRNLPDPALCHRGATV